MENQPTFSELQQRLVASVSPAVINHEQIHADNLLQEEPLIRFVNQMIVEAITQNVSDIHVEPFESCCRIRYRQHGVLRIAAELPPLLSLRMAARLKIMAELDISERRVPQDGRFQFQGTDIRINTCPVLNGEKCVLRLLQTTHTLPEMIHTGMSAEEQCLFARTLSQPQGMILVTGPTGSGKTVTLYAGLNHLNHPGKNIATVEDPIEIRFTGINQVNVNPRTGLQFATVLRALLRQDPDVIMVGEIRDRETAHIAIQAAQTGHFVLSTLHTNRASDALLRLLGMDIPASLMTASLRLIIAQRLLRVLCEYCKRPACPDRTLFPEVVHAGRQVLYEAVGCNKCIEGYTGRTAIFEFLKISPSLSAQLLKRADPETLEQIARLENPVSLRQAGVTKVMTGITSPAELVRVLET